jgi:NADPH:quinone reductase
MRAIRVQQFGAPEVMRVEDVESVPLGPGQVRVLVRAAGVNPVDTYIRGGQYGALPELPYTPGFDAAGEVVEVSPLDAKGMGWPRLGQRVWVGKRGREGTYASEVVCQPEQLHPLPDRLSFEEGAGVYVACCTAWRAIFGKAMAKPGETILIHGASGGVGLAAVQLARAAGLGVIGTAGTKEGLDAVMAAGAHAAVNHRVSGYEAEIRETLTRAWFGHARPRGEIGSAGIDIVLENLANVNLQRDLDLIAPRGRVVVVGNRGALEFNPRAAMGKEATIMGMSLMNMTAAEEATTYAGVQAALDAGALKPVVGAVLPLAEASEAHRRVMAGGHVGKIVLTP